MKETLKSLSLVKRFDKDWNEVEKPEKGSNADERLKYSYKLEAYNNAKECAVMPSMVDFLDKLEVQPVEQYESDWGFRIKSLKFRDSVVQPPLLSEFITAVEVDGVWTVLSEPDKWSDWLDFQRIKKTGELTMHPFTTLDMQELEQYQKALDKVKYEGWVVMVDNNRITRIEFNGVSITYDKLTKVYMTGDFYRINTVITPTEALITELSKHGVWLILK